MYSILAAPVSKKGRPQQFCDIWFEGLLFSELSVPIDRSKEVMNITREVFTKDSVCNWKSWLSASGPWPKGADKQEDEEGSVPVLRFDIFKLCGGMQLVSPIPSPSNSILGLCNTRDSTRSEMIGIWKVAKSTHSTSMCLQMTIGLRSSTYPTQGMRRRNDCQHWDFARFNHWTGLYQIDYFFKNYGYEIYFLIVRVDVQCRIEYSDRQIENTSWLFQ